ncbi:hypothetical protein DTO006G1_6413 [Penicillium roqueforti]|uniref:uncharacterized protein n=1 Tax=Penicillium roqueforti TaxID=5082 RepID=UPI00190A5CB5|nr:uncharacterized protein LCP9604111_8153 [Penicillium roqueforti]KAF9242245.1 hypothetical protein LCP9604111_8153 [Penicillium roqueforti]KAI1833412.1 hypothetical protein CBS147337_5910 [Penicillium roqueforti]KAI2671796.1 hypothetical protein CBS147355_8439 [Penicillium roqueforti]KAI2675154.1 hypothetical protein LCP963914a_8557 [Penicillium roqueforti]KAI2697620.1 hypothetical protein CBS147372_7661 [Penicillium roqueforti]
MMDLSISEVLLRRFNHSYDHMKDIHAALRKMEGASITDETMEHLGISVAEMDLKTGSESPYFAPNGAEHVPDPTQEKIREEPFVSRRWEWGLWSTRRPLPSYYLMSAFLYYQTAIKWLNRYLPKDQEDEKSTEADEEMREQNNDEKERSSVQGVDESSEESEEDMCSEWDSDEESDKESEEHEVQRRKRQEEWWRQIAERQRKIDEAEEARMVYEWNVYHYPMPYDFESRENHHDFKIVRTGNRNNPLQCHQWAVALIDESDENRPSITELLVLATRMLKAMNSQKRRVGTSQDENIQLHHLFPTTIVTFDDHTRARVLSGYYDNGLKVHFTESVDFEWCTTDKYNYGDLLDREWVNDSWYGELMSDLVAWAWPLAQMNTVQTLTLPIISKNMENEGNEL